MRPVYLVAYPVAKHLKRWFFSQIRHLCYCKEMSKTVQSCGSRDFLVWIDLEMTGLDVNIHKIVEVACLITDLDLNIKEEGLHLIVHQPKQVFENECDEWPRKAHEKSGLTQESINSKISIGEADSLVSSYIKRLTDYGSNRGKCNLAGNSVYMDKLFLDKYMPLTNELLHYQLVDVTSVKILCSAWYPEKFKTIPGKKSSHRALSDIHESVEELKTLRKHFFASEIKF